MRTAFNKKKATKLSTESPAHDAPCRRSGADLHIPMAGKVKTGIAAAAPAPLPRTGVDDDVAANFSASLSRDVCRWSAKARGTDLQKTNSAKNVCSLRRECNMRASCSV